MTWMPAPTWTPPAATSSSPSSSSSRRSLAAWNGASPSWRTKPNRAADRGCPASSPGPARNLRPPSSPGSPGPMAFPVDGWPPPTGWSTRWRAAPIAGPRCPAAGLIASGRSSTCPVSPRKSPSTSSSPGFAPATGATASPKAELDGAALGKQRLGVNLVSLIATLREEGRLPIRSIQWYLRTVHQFAPQRGRHRRSHPSHGATGPAAVSGILERIRGSPCFTPMRPAGGRTAPTAMCQRSARPPTATSCGVAEASRWWMKSSATGLAGVLVCDFYAAYHHYDGPKQLC